MIRRRFSKDLSSSGVWKFFFTNSEAYLHIKFFKKFGGMKSNVSSGLAQDRSVSCFCAFVVLLNLRGREW